MNEGQHRHLKIKAIHKHHQDNDDEHRSIQESFLPPELVAGQAGDDHQQRRRYQESQRPKEQAEKNHR